MHPKSEDEIYLRIAILEAYTSTRHYKDQYSRCHQKIEQAHKKHMLWKNGLDANQYDEKQFIKDADNLLAPLNDGTGIQHKCGVDGDQWYITTHNKADFLPFELQDDKSEQGFITLQFDAKQSINQQLSIAKSKLMDKRRYYYKEAWKDDENLPSSRQNMHKIYENLQIMIAYDDMTRELGEPPTWEMVGSKFDMKPNTARDKFQKISELLQNGSLLQYFPPDLETK